MITITIKQHGDVVFYLTGQGFEKGIIKTTRVISEKMTPCRIEYYVTTPDDEIFIGHKKEYWEIWDSYEEMLIHFQANPPA